MDMVIYSGLAALVGLLGVRALIDWPETAGKVARELAPAPARRGRRGRQGGGRRG